MDESAALQFGGDLLPIGEQNAFAEADLLWLTRDAFAVIECKAFDRLDDAKRAEIQESLERGLVAALRCDANFLVLAVAISPSAGDEIRSLVAGFASRTVHLPVGVHLILNGRMWVNGNTVEVQPDELRRVRISALAGVRPTDTPASFEGDRAPSSIPGGVRPSIDVEALERWDATYAVESAPNDVAID
jgi:hypothetical protein